MWVLVWAGVLFLGSISDPGQSLPLEKLLENFKEGIAKLRDPCAQGSAGLLA